VAIVPDTDFPSAKRSAMKCFGARQIISIKPCRCTGAQNVPRNLLRWCAAMVKAGLKPERYAVEMDAFL